MKIGFRKEEDIVVTKIEGPINASNAQVLKDFFNKNSLFDFNVIFDMEGVGFIDSTGLGGIISCLKSCNQNSKDLKVANLQAKPQMLFEITRAYKIFDIFDDINEALNSFKN